MSSASLSSYLASLSASSMKVDDAHRNEAALSPADSTSASSSSVSSPSKRARSDSPDTSISSSSPPESYFVKQSTVPGTTVSTSFNRPLLHSPAASSCSIIRSILCTTFASEHGTDFASVHASSLSSPGSNSPPLSRPLSRRSSTGCSQKSVRFARCTNASVFPALSGEEYDRSPIIPTTESESLELPKRKRGEAEGWIKCVERERAAAAKKGLGFKMGVDCKPCGPRPVVNTNGGTTTSSLENPVEGVHGLIEGGYFVGEERDVLAGSSVDTFERFSEEGDLGDVDDGEDMVVDDEQTGPGGHDPLMSMSVLEPGSLIQDDSSGDDELERASDLEEEEDEDEEDEDVDEKDDRDVTLMQRSETVTTPTAAGSAHRAVSPAAAPAVRPASPARENSVERTLSDQGSVDSTMTTTAASSSASSDGGVAAAAAAAAAKVKASKCRERYGLCALGKYTRQEVFQSYDSLGGF